MPRASRRHEHRGFVARQPIHKAYTPFADTELDLIDRWGFNQHIRDRSAAIRALVLRGLKADQAQQR
jgi:hypothetical protein